MNLKFRRGLVSVIIPTYNREDMVIEALDSVWKQTYRPLEVIIVDDGSSDGTRKNALEWIEKCARGKVFSIKYFYKKNAGVSSARNRGLIESSGEFIQYLDSDDLLFHEKIARQVRILLEYPEVDFVYSPVLKINAKGKSVTMVGSPMTGRIEDWIASYNWQTSGPLYRRTVSYMVGPWDEDLRMGDDLMHDVAVKIGGFNGRYFSTPLAFWRMHSGHQITKESQLISSINSERLANKIAQLLRATGIQNKAVNNVLSRYFLRSAIIYQSESQSLARTRCLNCARNMASGPFKILVLFVGFFIGKIPGLFLERFAFLWRLVKGRGP